jgi:uncharacterized protein (TIGR00159 family)
MQLLRTVLGTFVSIGFILLVIIFQPEVRRFLLVMGNTMKGRLDFLDNYFNISGNTELFENEESADDIITAVTSMSKTKTGGLIVLTDDFGWKNYANSGIELNANTNSQLLESIFFKNSPLHDGAVIMSADKVIAASCVVAVSQSRDIPSDLGLRHRAAVGVTENSSALAIVVSEETGKISVAKGGKLIQNISNPDLKEHILSLLH